MRETPHFRGDSSALGGVSSGILLLLVTFYLLLPDIARAAIHIGHSDAVSLTNGLIGYWPLDGATTNWTTGKTKDISGTGNDGNLISLSTSTSPIMGMRGQGMKFIYDNLNTVSLTNTPNLSNGLHIQRMGAS